MWLQNHLDPATVRLYQQGYMTVGNISLPFHHLKNTTAGEQGEKILKAIPGLSTSQDKYNYWIENIYENFIDFQMLYLFQW